MNKNILYMRKTYKVFVIGCTCGFEIEIRCATDNHIIICPDCGAESTLDRVRNKHLVSHLEAQAERAGEVVR